MILEPLCKHMVIKNKFSRQIWSPLLLGVLTCRSGEYHRHNCVFTKSSDTVIPEFFGEETIKCLGSWKTKCNEYKWIDPDGKQKGFRCHSVVMSLPPIASFMN